MCQNIVIGSQYPVCAALRISKWFTDRSEYDVARGETFQAIADSYIAAANDYLNLIESDHLATVLLEVKSDIDGLSALNMILEYELQSFVATNRVERITTSIMNNFEFLKPENRDDAFEINPLSLTLIWSKMWNKMFYFTPLGLFITTTVLYFLYLALFTYLSIQQRKVYHDIGLAETVFWILNSGYVLNEIQQMMALGFRKYFKEPSNYFDTVISVIFVTSLVIRLYGKYNCDETSCTQLATLFSILWGSATITLWLRVINFCVLSHKLGPMVQMIFKMMV